MKKCYHGNVQEVFLRSCELSLLQTGLVSRRILFYE